jgi:hypothetical protein
LYKLPYKVESNVYDMTGNHVTDKVYEENGGKCTYYTLFFLKKKVLLPVVVRQRPAPIMTNSTRQHDEEDDVTARSREAKWARRHALGIKSPKSLKCT